MSGNLSPATKRLVAFIAFGGVTSYALGSAGVRYWPRVVMITVLVGLIIALGTGFLVAAPTARRGRLVVVGPLVLLVIGVAGQFGFIYEEMSTSDRGAFTERLSPLDAMYFSAAVMTTTGFGDISPKSQAARAVVTIQMTGTIVLGAVAFARVTAVVTKE